MDKEHIKGAADKAKGAVKDAAGKLMDDKELQAEGKMDKAKGEAQAASATSKTPFGTPTTGSRAIANSRRAAFGPPFLRHDVGHSALQRFRGSVGASSSAPSAPSKAPSPWTGLFLPKFATDSPIRCQAMPDRPSAHFVNGQPLFAALG